jgi:hypothetical protein
MQRNHHIAPFNARKIYVLFVIIRRSESMRASPRYPAVHERPLRSGVFRPPDGGARASQGTPLARPDGDSYRIFAVVSRFHFHSKGYQMKTRTTWIVAALLALSGSAFAQGGGTGNGGGAAGGGGNGAGMSSSDQTGAGMAASGTHASSKMHHKKSTSHTKPATDTTNMPGADASSDTKGQ